MVETKRLVQLMTGHATRCSRSIAIQYNDWCAWPEGLTPSRALSYFTTACVEALTL